MKNKIYLSLIAAILLASAGLSACDNNANGQDGELRVDFMQNVVSGSVELNGQGEDPTLQLEVSPFTSFFSENPGFQAGIMSTDLFFDQFTEIFGGLSPNSVLAIRQGETAISVPIELSSPDYDPDTGTVVFTVRQLEQNPAVSFQGVSIEIMQLDELTSPFESAFLFIDSGIFDPGGILDPNGGPCSDGANMVCPITPDNGMCLNLGAGPECCSLSVTSCGNCDCN